MDAIQGDPSYKDITSGPIDLSDTEGTVAKDYEQSVIVTKKFNTLDLDLNEFLHDVNLMLSLFYDFVYEDYLEELENQIEQGNSNNDGNKSSTNDDDTKSKKKGNESSTIHPDHYQQLIGTEKAQ